MFLLAITSSNYFSLYLSSVRNTKHSSSAIMNACISFSVISFVISLASCLFSRRKDLERVYNVYNGTTQRLPFLFMLKSLRDSRAGEINAGYRKISFARFGLARFSL